MNKIHNCLNKYFQVTMILALLFLLSACSQEERIENHGELKNVIIEYYNYEKLKNWTKTYAFRIPEYRNAEKESYYIKTMEQDDAGWKLNGIEIVSVHTVNNKVSVSIRFTETPPPGFLKKLGLPQDIKVMQTIDNSIWIKYGENWFSYDAAQRSHLPLNAPLVYIK